jgi:hypothetical protein
MQVALVNQTKSLLIVTLNGGTSLYMAPGQTSESVDYMEIAGNEKIEKLRKTGAVAIVNARAA